jgi:hypothetical protein
LPNCSCDLLLFTTGWTGHELLFLVFTRVRAVNVLRWQAIVRLNQLIISYFGFFTASLKIERVKS